MASPVKAPNLKSLPASPGICYATVFGLLVLAFVMFFFRLGSYPLFDLDEPRYAEAAREMIERGNWITPYFNYELRFDKPVFFYWLVALAYKMFGLSEFSARFFSAVTATATVGMTYWFGKQWVSHRFGLLSAIILSTAVMFVGLARMSITDMTLSFWMTATTLCLFMAAHRNLRWWLAAGLFAGLGVLTKGPVALVLPGAILCIYTWLIGDFKRCLLNRWLPLALLICGAVAIPWYVLAYQQNGQIFIDALFLHNVTRFSDTVSGHRQPIYFYVIVLLAGFMPWTIYLPAACQRLWEQARTAHKKLVQEQSFTYLLPLYAFVWIAFTFLFFTFSHTKLLTYILPLFPALALLCASGLLAETENVIKTEKTSPWFTVPAWALVAATIVGGLFFILRMDKLLPREAAGVQANEFNLVAVLVMILGALITAILMQKKQVLKALSAQVATMALVLVVAMMGIVPNISKAAQGVMMEYLHRTGGKPLMLYETQRPSLTYYGKRRVPRFVEEDRSEIIQELNRNPKTFVITRTNYSSQFIGLLPASMQVETLEKGSVYSLLAVHSKP